MEFASIAVKDAAGTILAHSTPHGEGVFKKGRKLSSADVAALQAAGVARVTVARLSADDMPEDDAARLVSAEACGPGARLGEAFTGRANLYSEVNGLVLVDGAGTTGINGLHEGLTIATLPDFARVRPRQMIATIKIIPFALPRAVVKEAVDRIGGIPLVRVAAFNRCRAGLVLTRLAQTKSSILTKSEQAMRTRLEDCGSELALVETCDHAPDAIADSLRRLQAAGCSPLLVMGASAIVDRADVIPAGLEAAGGEVQHLGMPVDPGNLLMLGKLGLAPVIGVPTCARSPKVNGFDWVLERVLAGIVVTPAMIMGMGVGGLLAEIPSRPSPREGLAPTPMAPSVTAIVLAAGQSRRMGSNKLLQDFHGRSMIAATVQQIARSSVDRIIVVLGRDADAVKQAVGEVARCSFVENPGFAEGIASSIRRGVAAAGGSEAVLVCLGDMPLVQPATINKLIAAFNPTEHRTIMVPTVEGRLGNPVLWGAEHFGRLAGLEGDAGARALLAGLRADLVEVSVPDSGILLDADTPEALAALRGSAG